MAKLYGLLGQKLGHSFSKNYFTEKFHHAKTDAVYENFEIAEIEEFETVIRENPNLAGLNVTIPYKEAIIPYLDGLTLTAELVGAVNVIEFRNGRHFGHNTDVVGFRESLSEVYEPGPGGVALILGTGGASKAVKYALSHYFAFDEIIYVSRNPSGENVIGYDDLDAALMKKTLLVVNTTPLGMFPDVDSMPDIPVALLQKECLVFDLTYNPTETKLLQAAKAHGCMIKNGMAMLVKQADAGWSIWNGKPADPDKR